MGGKYVDSEIVDIIKYLAAKRDKIGLGLISQKILGLASQYRELEEKFDLEQTERMELEDRNCVLLDHLDRLSSENEALKEPREEET